MSQNEEQPTVNTLVQKLRDASHPFSSNVINGDKVAVSPTYKDHIYGITKQLAELLGVELES